MRSLNKIPIGIFSIFLFISLWGCSAKDKNRIPAEVRKLKNLTILPAGIKPDGGISLKKDNVYGDSKSGLLGRVGDVAVDDSGRIFIADLQQKQIHIFKPDGTYLKKLGGEGRGPGEFGHIFDMKIQGNSLFAFDPTVFQLNFYSLESLTFDHAEGLFFQDWADIKNIKEASPMKFYEWGDQNMLIGFDQIPGTNIYYYMVRNSNYRTKIISKPILIQKDNKQTWLEIELPNAVGSRDLPFGRQSLIAVTEDRHIFTAWTELFLIKEYDPEGTYLRAWYYPYKNPPLKQAAIDSIVNPKNEANVQRALDKYEAPTTWPALDDMKIDDKGRIWVSTVVRDHSVYRWWVLTQDGKLLARFKWPHDKSIKVVKNGYIYTMETKKKTDVNRVARYKIEMDKGQN